MKPYAEKFYKSKEWVKCRDSYFDSRFGICERCGDIGIIVHHKTYITPDNINNPMITLSWDNLELLCQDCHNKEHKGESPIRDGFRFDEFGNFVPC